MLSGRIKELRTGQEISQAGLAKILGVSQQAVAKWEAAKSEPDSSTLTRMANYFNVSVDYLLGNEQKYFSAPTSKDESRLLNAFRNLTTEGQSLVFAMIAQLPVRATTV